MMRPKYDSWSPEDADCYIKRKDEFLKIKNGILIDPVGGSSTVLDFFYCNALDKMVHIEYRHVLKELLKTRVEHSYRSRRNKRRNRSSNSDLLKTIKDLQEKVELVTEKLSNALQPKKPLSFMRKRNAQAIESSQSEQDVKIKKLEPKLRMKMQDTSESMFSHSETENRLLPKPSPKTNDTMEFPEKIVCSESETNLDGSDDINPPKLLPFENENNIVSKSSTNRQKKTETCVQIDSDTLKIIGFWASRNKDFFPYKGMRQVPDGTFENDDEYFLKFLSLLNPTVPLVDYQVQRNQPYQETPSNVMSQEEFSNKIGLVRVTNISDMDSSFQKSQSEPRTLRKRTNTAINFYEEPKLNIKVSATHKMNYFPANISNVDNRSAERYIAQKHLKKTDEPSVHLGDSSKIDDEEPDKSGFERVLLKGKANLPFPSCKYSAAEDREIIKWVLENDHSKKVSGNTIWIQLEKKGIMPGVARTWQSLRNRFLKTILGQLRAYGLTYDQEMQLKTGALKGSLKLKTKTIYNPSYGIIPMKPVSKPSQIEDNINHKYNGKPTMMMKDVSRYTRRAVLANGYKELPCDGDDDNSRNKVLKHKRKLHTNKTFQAMSDKSSISK